jgi:hypothetical protein
VLEGPLSIVIDELNFDPDWILIGGKKVDFIYDESKKLHARIQQLDIGKTAVVINDPNLFERVDCLEFKFSLTSPTLKFLKILSVARSRFATIRQTAVVKDDTVYRTFQVSTKAAAQLCYYILIDDTDNPTKIEPDHPESHSSLCIVYMHKLTELKKRAVFCFRVQESEFFTSVHLEAVSALSIFAELESSFLQLHKVYKMNLSVKACGASPIIRYSLNFTDESTWMVVGKKTGLIDSRSAPVTVQIIPLRCGLLPLPLISVESPIGLVNIPSNGAFVSVKQ